MPNKLLYVHLVYAKNDDFVDDYIGNVIYKNSDDINLFLVNNMKRPYNFNYNGRFRNDPEVSPGIFICHGGTFTELVRDAIKVAKMSETLNGGYDYLCIKDMDDKYFDSVPTEVFKTIDSSKIGAVYFNEETVRGDKVSKEYGDLPDREFTAMELAEWTTNNHGPIFMQRQFKFIHKDIVTELYRYYGHFVPSGNMGEDSLYTLAVAIACNELNRNIYCSNRVFGQYIRSSDSSTLSLSNEERFMQFTDMHLGAINWIESITKTSFSNRMILYRFLLDRTKGQLTSYEYYKNRSADG